MVAVLLIIAWGLWFFLAGLTLHETGQLTGVTASGAVVAEFPSEVADRIRSGQPAALRLQGIEQGLTFPAIVIKVSKPQDTEPLQVELYPQSRIAYASLGRALGRNGDNTIMGQAAIEIARVTPAALLMRTLSASRNANTASSPSTR